MHSHNNTVVPRLCTVAFPCQHSGIPMAFLVREQNETQIHTFIYVIFFCYSYITLMGTCYLLAFFHHTINVRFNNEVLSVAPCRLFLKKFQPEGITHNRDRTQHHSQRSKHGIKPYPKKGVECSKSNGNAQNVVDECPE